MKTILIFIISLQIVASQPFNFRRALFASLDLNDLIVQVQDALKEEKIKILNFEEMMMKETKEIIQAAETIVEIQPKAEKAEELIETALRKMEHFPKMGPNKIQTSRAGQKFAPWGG